MEKYNFSMEQAKAIVDMKLGKLAGLEKIEIQQEADELVAKINALQTLLSSEKNLEQEVRDRLAAIVKKYGDARRTELVQIEVTKEDKEIETVIPEDCVVVVSQTGDIKRVAANTFKVQRRNGKGVKTEGEAILSMISTNTVDNLMIFTDKGKMYRLLVDDIPEGNNTTKGQPIKSLVVMEPNEEPTIIYSIYRDTEAQYVLFVTKSGLVKKTPLDEYVQTRRKSGVAAITLAAGDSLAAVSLIKDEELLLMADNGQIIRFKSSDITPTGRAARGVKGIGLAEGSSIVAALPIRDAADDLAIFSPTGLGKRIVLTDIPLQARAGKGSNYAKAQGIAAASLVNDEDNVLIIGDSTSICISAAEIPVAGKTAEGNSIIKSRSVKSVSKV
jgi:DNA gyrase subunit A